MAKPNKRITRQLIDHIADELRKSDISRVRTRVRHMLKTEAGTDDTSTSFGFNIHNVPQDVYDTFDVPELATKDRTTIWKNVPVGACEITLFLHIPNG